MARLPFSLLLILALSACGKTAPVLLDTENAAHKAVNLEYELKGPRKFIETWYAVADPTGGMICGTFEPQGIEQPYGPVRRYIFSNEGGVMIDPIPELQITLSPVTKAIIDQTDSAFEQTWSIGCKDFEPGPFKQVTE